MRSKVITGIIFGFFLATSCLGALTQISYTATDIGSDRWEYSYTVENIGLVGGIEEFTIWFDYGLYDNLIVTTPETPPEWDQIVWQVEPVLKDPGGYDALAKSLNIGVGENVSGFSVSFDWIGVGDPGSQIYHIINPDNYSVPIETGYTVPEPATCLLLLSGLLFLRKSRSGEVL